VEVVVVEILERNPTNQNQLKKVESLVLTLEEKKAVFFPSFKRN